jgi:hypothetical protein
MHDYTFLKQRGGNYMHASIKNITRLVSALMLCIMACACAQNTLVADSTSTGGSSSGRSIMDY